VEYMAPHVSPAIGVNRIGVWRVESV
jgi:hypothetical protein